MPVVFDALAGGIYRYHASAATRADAIDCEVRRDDVQPQLLEQTERVVRMAARSLGLDPAPRLRWLPASTPGVRGVVYDEQLGEVWIKVQPPALARESALHEVKHVEQLRGQKYLSLGLDTYEARQLDAQHFAESWTPTAPPPPSSPSAEVKAALIPLDRKAAATAGTIGEFTGYVATWDVDQTNERFVPGCFAVSLQRRAHRPLLWSHRMDAVVGVEVAIGEDARGLKGTWRFADTTDGRDARELVRSGSVTAMSIGYWTIESRTAAGDVREITVADAVESSLVALPANEAAMILSSKGQQLDLHLELLRRRAAQVRRGQERRRGTGVRA